MRTSKLLWKWPWKDSLKKILRPSRHWKCRSVAVHVYIVSIRYNQTINKPTQVAFDSAYGLRTDEARNEQQKKDRKLAELQRIIINLKANNTGDFETFTTLYRQIFLFVKVAIGSMGFQSDNLADRSVLWRGWLMTVCCHAVKFRTETRFIPSQSVNCNFTRTQWNGGRAWECFSACLAQVFRHAQGPLTHYLLTTTQHNIIFSHHTII